MTELDQLLAMFTRCGIPFQRYDDAKRGQTEVSVSPPRREEGEPSTGPLTGVHWASADYRFDTAGQLVGIDMEGD